MAKYSVIVSKYRPQKYGSAGFYIGGANTLESAKKLIKKNTKHGDSYCIAKSGQDCYRKANQVRTGVVFGSGKTKICKDGEYTPHF